MFCYHIPANNKQLDEGFVCNVTVTTNFMFIETATPLDYLSTGSGRVLYPEINIATIGTYNLIIH